MSRFNNKELIAGIQNGNEEIIVYLSEKYFPYARKLLRTKGISDSSTPEFFSNVLVKVCFDVIRHQLPTSIELETFFFNSLNDVVHEEKKNKHANRMKVEADWMHSQVEVVAQCVSILDEQSIKLVQAYYAERLSFETMAVRFNYSNPVIAQHEVNKAIAQLEGIVRLRLNMSEN